MNKLKDGFPVGFLAAIILILFSGPVQASPFLAPSNAKEFKVKGFHLDLRIQVMKPEALKAFALKLSKSGINTLIMEYEATFPFQKHPLIPNRYAYKKEEIKDFVQYCGTIGIDVIPLQQSFGHVEYILRNNRYTKLREDQKDYSQVNPLEEKLSRELFTDLFKELAEVHPSKYLHIGCDETRLLGRSPKSKAKVEKEGVGKLYGDYVAMICDIVLKMGKVPVLWADIALKYPESLKLLPKGVVFVDWNYGWEMDKFGDHSQLMKSGFEIWGAPSLRSSPDNYNLTTWSKHFDNIRDFVPKAQQLGYQGMVMTSWSTSGVYSYLYESGSDIIDLYAVRRVYPLTGFNILLDAYLKSIDRKEPLKINAFIENYAQNQYGLDPVKSQAFKDALLAVPYQVVNGIVRGSNMSVRQLLDSVRLVNKVFEEIRPLKNVAEFEHYRVISGTRLQYLIYQDIENRANGNSFTAEQLPALISELKSVISSTKALNKKYLAINKQTFYPSELEEDNHFRIVKMQLLYYRLSRLR